MHEENRINGRRPDLPNIHEMDPDPVVSDYAPCPDKSFVGTVTIAPSVIDGRFKNASNLQFKDLSSEAWREYLFANGVVVRIDNPLNINVGENGHRIFDAAGICHYVPKGWVHLKWKVKPGRPHFDF